MWSALELQLSPSGYLQEDFHILARLWSEEVVSFVRDAVLEREHRQVRPRLFDRFGKILDDEVQLRKLLRQSDRRMTIRPAELCIDQYVGELQMTAALHRLWLRCPVMPSRTPRSDVECWSPLRWSHSSCNLQIDECAPDRA